MSTVATPPPKRPYLLLLQQTPWLLNGGAVIRNYWMAVALARRYALDLVIAERSDVAAPPDFAASCASIAAFPKPSKAAYELRRAMSALNPRESYFTAGQTTLAHRAHIAQLVRERRYVAVQIGDLNQQGALPRTYCPPLWYDAHNCESELVARQARHERFPLNVVVGIDAARVRRIESEIVARSTYVTTCTDQDLDDLAAFCPSMREKSTMIPSGVDVARHADVRAAQPRRGCILLSGSFTWRPTLQGLRWFIENVMPLIAQGAGDLDLEFRIAGRMYPTLVEELSTVPGLVVVPNPPDMRSELARAHVIAVPVLASSGVRVRIYEAWAAGRPVVTTPTGALGLEYTSGEELVAAAQPRDFADGVLRLVRDAALWQHVRETALRRVADFDWPRIVERIIALHERVFPDPAAIVGASLGGVPS